MSFIHLLMLSEVQISFILIFNFQIFINDLEHFGVQLIYGALAGDRLPALLNILVVIFNNTNAKLVQPVLNLSFVLKLIIIFKNCGRRLLTCRERVWIRNFIIDMHNLTLWRPTSS